MRLTGAIRLWAHYGCLVASGLLLYWAHLSSPAEGDSERRILNLQLADLKSINYAIPEKTAKVSARVDGGFEIAIEQPHRNRAPITQHSQPPVPTDAGPRADAGSNREAPPRPIDSVATGTDTSRYRLNQKFEKIWNNLLPLMAKRDLGVLPEADYPKYGFIAGERELTIEFSNRKTKFEIGKSTFGRATVYLLDKGSKRVYLMSSELIRAIDFQPQQYMDRRLFGFEHQALSAIQVQTDQSSTLLVREGKGDTARWVQPNAVADGQTAWDNWADSLFQLSVQAYPAEEPIADLRQIVRITFAKGKNPVETLALAWTRAPKTDANDPSPERKRYFARTGFTGRWVRLFTAAAQTVHSDLTSMTQQQ